MQFIVDRPSQFIDRNQRRASRRNGFERFLNGQAHARGRLQHGLNSPTSEVVHDCRMPGCVMERGRQLLLLLKGGAPFTKSSPQVAPRQECGVPGNGPTGERIHQHGVPSVIR